MLHVGKFIIRPWQIFIFRLILLAGFAYFCASAVAVLFLYKEQDLSTPGSYITDKGEASQKFVSIEQYQPIKERNIFNTATPEKETPLSPGYLPQSTLNIKLLGTVYSADESVQRAVILNGNKQALYKPGDEILGYTIDTVLRRGIILKRNGKTEKLTIAEDEQGKASLSGAGGRQQPVADKASNALKSIMQTVRLIPYNRKGQRGFYISRLRVPSSLYKAGLRRRDIIVSINGQPVAEKAADDIQEMLLSSSVALIEVVRNNSVEMITLNLAELL